MNSPLISVVMPVRNGQATVVDAAQSILQQTLRDLELIVVNDHSTDDTAALLQRLATADNRLQVLTATGMGISDALNQGIAHARAPLIARMDADDIAVPHRLDTQYHRFQEAPDLVLLGSHYRMFSDVTGHAKEVISTFRKKDVLEQLQTRATLLHPTVMMDAAALRQIGGYRKQFDGAEDHDLYLRLSRVGDIEVLDQSLLHYRIHEGQVSARSETRGLCASVAAAFSHLCIRNGAADPALSGRDNQGMALDMLRYFTENPQKFTRDHAKLCERALIGLSHSPADHRQGLALRNQLLLKILVRMNLRSAYALWRRTKGNRQSIRTDTLRGAEML